VAALVRNHPHACGSGGRVGQARRGLRHGDATRRAAHCCCAAKRHETSTRSTIAAGRAPRGGRRRCAVCCRRAGASWGDRL
jgi:hypothetical protein